MTIRFDQRIAIVTGAGRGLGRAYALALAERGAHVVVNDLGNGAHGRGESSAADAVASEIRSAGGKASSFAGSVSDASAVADLVAETIARHGRIDIVVNNAGILRDKSFHKMDFADFEAVIDVHLMGSARLTHAVWGHMRKAGYGRIVMATSSSGLYGNFGQANYAAAKLGLVGLMQTLGIEGEKYNVRVNAIAPVGYTDMTAGLFPQGADRAVPPELVAPGVVFLSSEEAPNRAILAAGGGAYAVTHMVETRGLMLGANSDADTLAARYAEIADPATAEVMATGPNQTAKHFVLLSQ